MNVRPIEPRDREQWVALRIALWPEADPAELAAEGAAHFNGALAADIVFVSEGADGALDGMIEAGLRSVAEACLSSPVPYVEAWFVHAQARHCGIGRALIAAVEDWARAAGYTELASDALLGNTLSHTAYGRVGFAEVDRLVVFRKDL